jgi:hypothetical protein
MQLQKDQEVQEVGEATLIPSDLLIFLFNPAFAREGSARYVSQRPTIRWSSFA